MNTLNSGQGIIWPPRNNLATMKLLLCFQFLTWAKFIGCGLHPAKKTHFTFTCQITFNRNITINDKLKVKVLVS